GGQSRHQCRPHGRDPFRPSSRARPGAGLTKQALAVAGGLPVLSQPAFLVARRRRRRAPTGAPAVHRTGGSAGGDRFGKNRFRLRGEAHMAKINKVLVGESLVGEGNEIAHIDLIMGPRGSHAESAFCNALTNNKDGFTALLAVIAPNLACKPN